MGYIDTDTHVIECEESWDYLEPSEREHRPVTVEVPGVNGAATKQMYLIGESFCRRFPTNGQGLGFGTEYSAEVSHLRDPAVRLRKMDALGIDAQIVISTNFIAAELDNPLAEAAVMRSWNRWMADRTADSGGRLRWALVCPTRTLSRACEELEFGKAHGAAGIMIKGVDHGYYLSDPYFYPLYEKAQELDLTIVVHQGAARQHIEGLGITGRKTSIAAHLHYAGTVMKGFYAVLQSDLHKRFPRLRWAFVESGASWVPFVFHHLARTYASSKADSFIQTTKGPSRIIKELDAREEMEARNMYIACETDEDLPYLTSVLGDRHIMCGTDMCHNDNGSDPLAHTVIVERKDIDAAVAQRIVDTNGRNAFGIPQDFTPTARLSPVARREVDLAVL